MQIDGSALTRLAVLKTIRRNGPISRVELAGATRLSGATITQITTDLLQRGLIIEEREAPDGKGRPRTQLTIDPNAATVIGASLGPRGTLEVSLVDLGGGVVEQASYDSFHHDSVEDLARRIAEQLQRFCGDVAERGSRRIASCAVALPGTIENPAGIVHWIPTMRAGSTPVRDIIADMLDLPVTIENDIDCLARAEHWFGLVPIEADFTILEIGLTIGMAEYVGGLPRLGANGLSSEFGHVKTALGSEARACYCGARGCLTAYASTAGMVRSHTGASELWTTDPADFDAPFAALAAAAVAGEKDARAAIEIAGTHLGIALANLVNARDPGLVLIRYTDPDVPAMLGQSIMSVFEENCLPAVRQRTRIDLGFAQEGWRWRGAAALALEQTYLGNVPIATPGHEGIGRPGRQASKDFSTALA